MSIDDRIFHLFVFSLFVDAPTIASIANVSNGGDLREIVTSFAIRECRSQMAIDRGRDFRRSNLVVPPL